MPADRYATVLPVSRPVPRPQHAHEVEYGVFYHSGTCHPGELYNQVYCQHHNQAARRPWSLLPGRGTRLHRIMMEEVKHNRELPEFDQRVLSLLACSVAAMMLSSGVNVDF